MPFCLAGEVERTANDLINCIRKSFMVFSLQKNQRYMQGVIIFVDLITWMFTNCSAGIPSKRDSPILLKPERVISPDRSFTFMLSL